MPDALKRLWISAFMRAFCTADSSAPTTSSGRFAGPDSHPQARISNPGITVASSVGTSGRNALRSFVKTASGRTIPLWTWGHPGVEIGYHEIDVTADQVRHRRRVAAIRGASDVDPGPALQCLTDQLPQVVAMAIRQLAG